MSTHNSTYAHLARQRQLEPCGVLRSGKNNENRARWFWKAPPGRLANQFIPHQKAAGPHSYLFVRSACLNPGISDATAHEVVSRRYNFPVPEPNDKLISEDEREAILKAMTWQASIADKTKVIIREYYGKTERAKHLRDWAKAHAESASADNVWIIFDKPLTSVGLYEDEWSNLSLDEAMKSVKEHKSFKEHTQVQSSQPSYSPASNAMYDPSGPSQVNRPSRTIRPIFPSDTQAISSNRNFGSQSGHALAPNTHGRTSHPPSGSSFHTAVQQQTPYHSQLQPAVVLPRSLSGPADSNFTYVQVAGAASQPSDFFPDGLPYDLPAAEPYELSREEQDKLDEDIQWPAAKSSNPDPPDVKSEPNSTLDGH